MTHHLTLVHGSASHGGQWRPLLERLPADWQASTPTLIGYDGRMPALDRYDLAQEVDGVLRAMPQAPTVLVGHSLGGVIALAAFLAQPQRVRALVLVEPVLFTLVDQGRHAAVGDRVRTFFHGFTEAVRAGRREQAAMDFFRFWRMEAAWERLDVPRRALVAAAMDKVALECGLLGPGALSPGALAAAPRVPTLLLSGTRSAAHMPPVMEELARLWPHAGRYAVEGAGHMLPVTHPAETAERLLDFVRQLPGSGPAPVIGG
jgi:pimeloyl-ACP methyl ester carboxylesterase